MDCLGVGEELIIALEKNEVFFRQREILENGLCCEYPRIMSKGREANGKIYVMSYKCRCEFDLCSWGKWLKLQQKNFLISTDECILSKISRSCKKVDFLCFLQEHVFDLMEEGNE